MANEDLAGIIRSHGIALDGASLEAALSDADQGPSFSEWARLHLTPDTLLSVDELELYASLERSGKADQLAASVEGAAVSPLSDGEIRSTIDELSRSTEAISKHAETLRQQQDALARLVRTSAAGSEARASFELRQLQQWESSRQRLAAEVSELSQALEFRLSDVEQRDRAAGSDLHQTVDSLCRSDDKLLTSLQKLGWELQTEDPEEQERVGELRDICARLIKYTVETIRTKLDRLYLDSLQTAHRTGARDRVAPDEVSTLQEELESLYAEILPVAQMSVEQQYLEPALKSLAGKNGQGITRSVEALSYVGECLDFLLDHIHQLSGRVETFKAHQSATSSIIATARAELATEVAAPKQEPRPATAASPAHRRKPSGPGPAVSPVRKRAVSGARRRSSGTGLDLPPLEELLQDLALTLPQPDELAASGGVGNATVDATAMQVNFLATTLDERTEKASDVARSVQEAFEATASAQLADARRAVRLARESVLAESPFGEVKLVDPEIEGSIAVLAQEVRKIDARLESVDKDVETAKGRSAKRDELISRWG